MVRVLMLSWASLLATRVCLGTCLVNSGLPATLCVLCSPRLVPVFSRFLNLSGACYGTWLVEQGAYDPGLALVSQPILWYLFMLNTQHRGLVLTWATTAVQSLERWYRNARWLERECGEMFDIWFAAKRDRRALFLVPLLYWAPLRRVFPTAGFFEVRLQGQDAKLVLVHVSWLD